MCANSPREIALNFHVRDRTSLPYFESSTQWLKDDRKRCGVRRREAVRSAEEKSRSETAKRSKTVVGAACHSLRHFTAGH
jgi:hypothetical protein